MGLLFPSLHGYQRSWLRGDLVVGPMSATAGLSAAPVAAMVPVGSDRFVAMTAALAIATGISALVAGVLRLGFLASFISDR